MKNNIDEFLKIEEKYGLYEDVIQGVNYWNYIRYWLYSFDIMEQYLGLTHRSMKKHKLTVKACADLVRAYIKGRKELRIRGNREVLFVIHPRRVKIEEKYISVYTDLIAKEFESYVSVEVPQPFPRVEGVVTEHLYYAFDDLIVYKLKSFIERVFLKEKRKKLIEEIGFRLTQPFNEINAIYGIDLNVEKWAKEAANMIPKVNHYKKVMNLLLDRFNPKVIVEVVSYNTYCMAFNEVARERGIPIVELQHGAIHSEHAGYKFLTEKTVKNLPNEILLFSEYWKSFIQIPKKDCLLVATGFPYFENNVTKLRRSNSERDSRITITFVSQETVGEELSLLATELARKLSKERYRIIYKLHPGECTDWKNKFGYMNNESIEVIDSLNYGIYELFAISDIQVGVYSSAIYEGLGFRLKTYIYNIGYANTMEYLVEQGYADYFENVDQLIDMIEHSSLKNEAATSFWEIDSMNNVVGEIKRVGGII